MSISISGVECLLTCQLNSPLEVLYGYTSDVECHQLLLAIVWVVHGNRGCDGAFHDQDWVLRQV